MNDGYNVKEYMKSKDYDGGLIPNSNVSNFEDLFGNKSFTKPKQNKTDKTNSSIIPAIQNILALIRKASEHLAGVANG